jgi:glycogen debranching enzyme
MTNCGPIPVLDGESIISVEPARFIRPAQLSNPIVELCRLCGVDRAADIGRYPPVASLSTAGSDNDSDHFHLFEVVFGRDALKVASAFRHDFPELLKTTIAYLAGQQGLPREIAPEAEQYDAREEEDGRIAHEIRDPDSARARTLTEIEGWGWPFYRSDDATVLFVVALAELAEEDPATLTRMVRQRDGQERPLHDSLMRALGWANRKAANAEGLLESVRPERQPGRPGLPSYAVWQDSADSAFRPDGSLTTGPVAWAELQSAYHDGLMAVARLAENPATANFIDAAAPELRERARLLRESVRRFLWVEAGRADGYFSFGAERVNGGLHALPVLKSNAGALLHSSLLDGDESRPLVEAHVQYAMDPRNGLVCPTGMRTCSSREARFTPRSYHNGQVWPLDNHEMAAGFRRHGFVEYADWIDGRIVENCRALHCYPENLVGWDRDTPLLGDVLAITAGMDPVYGEWRNAITAPQLIQGFTLAAYWGASEKVRK